MENGDETFASPTAAAAEFDLGFGPALTNGGGHAKAYDPEEMDALRAAKHGLEEKLAEVRHENGFLSAEAARLEALVAGAREDIAAADRAAAKAEGEAAGLRAEVKRLQGLLAAFDSSDRAADGPRGAGGDLATAHQEKLALEEEIKALKAAAAAAASDKEGKEEEAAPSAKEGLVAPHGTVAAAAAAGAAATAAIAVVLLNLKR
ncbi:antifreeze protein Maxi-like [Hordeum vulgare]|uniref:Predicted protein n=1 Tax=Hordeum vulgare subsp. vulgare TaxID=112509 RepID=F2CR14_HORVV|nr:antifreeze protein Maxi-like [Hordeum vulgare subsp. vulgare]KAE8816364.1 antifreeze protein Maxi-like [Hordeum vulgare]KAI5019634.1 hypothetical protein ZWY2020_044522 [Hordeum vulgare]BAJ85285.1 predicted protein [Hordeum vulgare subsp. vulgare]BAJ98542.1 predicted protein [Hordeum vulgare subsp. vulgare]